MNVFQAYGVNCSFTAENQNLWGRMWGRIFINIYNILFLLTIFSLSGGQTVCSSSVASTINQLTF